jgi:FKBP-type peptidyl-prolyl cis-trans isomerase
VFDSSWKRGAPTQFSISGVVPGFQKALVGQKVGSQVVAVVTPADGYGDKGSGSIPANATLVFVIDILGAVPAAAAQ